MHDVLPPYLASCDVFATASLSEMNSISMLEAMATGLPVLQRYDELNADQIREGINGFTFQNAEEFAKHLRYIRALSAEQLQALKTSVIDSVHQNGAEEIADCMLNVYQKALEKQQQ